MPDKRVKVFSLPFDSQRGEFDDSELQAFCAEVEVVAVSDHLLSSGDKHYLVVSLIYIGEPEVTKNNYSNGDPAFDLDQMERNAYEALRQWRLATSRHQGVPPYHIAHNKHLVQLIKMRVETKEDMKQIKHFSKENINQYGDEILHILQERLRYCTPK